MFSQLFSLVILLGLCDSISYRVLKAQFKRPRPPYNFKVHAILKVPHKPSSYSMPSNHAISNFASAYFLSQLFIDMRVYFWLIAFLISYSRVYVGVHYPLDIFVGGTIGLFFGYIWIFFTKKITQKINKYKMSK